ncbi:MAG: hypothetical protein ACLGI3_18335 [Actinomycetes bacterium]
MTEQRPDTDERYEPAGTPSAGQGNLTAKPVAPGADDPGTASAVPGVYEADDAAQERGTAAKPGS